MYLEFNQGPFLVKKYLKEFNLNGLSIGDAPERPLFLKQKPNEGRRKKNNVTRMETLSKSLAILDALASNGSIN